MKGKVRVRENMVETNSIRETSSGSILYSAQHHKGAYALKPFTVQGFFFFSFSTGLPEEKKKNTLCDCFSGLKLLQNDLEIIKW